jgi:thiol-disulfide isomerase/thioredoxin
MLASCARLADKPITPFLQGKRAAAFIFLSPDCPLSQNYTLTLNNLHKEFVAGGIEFYGVFSGEGASKAGMDDFVATYRVSFPVTLDAESKIADFFGAMKTPEAFLTDAKGQIIYKGAIDNFAPELGQHRTVVTENYLLDALTSVRENKPIKVTQTQAVGCFIERKTPG